MQNQTVHPAQVNGSVFGNISAVIQAACSAVIMTAVKSTVLVEKTMNTAIHGVSAAENIAEAAEKRSEIYGAAMVKNGVLSEREQELKHKMRLSALERQEEAIRNGTAEYVADPGFKDKFTNAVNAAKDAVGGGTKVHNDTIKAGEVEAAVA